LYVTAMQVLKKSLVYFLILATVDMVASLVLAIFMGVSIITTVFGYLALFEMAILFIVGGMLDAWQSGSGVAARRMIWRDGRAYSAQRHRDAQKKGASFILAGVWFVIVALIFLVLNI